MCIANTLETIVQLGQLCGLSKILICYILIMALHIIVLNWLWSWPVVYIPCMCSEYLWVSDSNVDVVNIPHITV